MPDLTTTVPELAEEFLLQTRREQPYPVPQEAEFNTEEDGEIDYLPADDLAAIARQLVARWPELSHLQKLDLSFLWKREGGIAKGQLTLGRCTKASGLVRHFAQVSYVIWLAADHARNNSLTNHQVAAALYHELCHTAEDLTIVGHDVEMFGAEVRRFGLWREPLRIAKRAFEQLPLFPERKLADFMGQPGE